MKNTDACGIQDQDRTEYCLRIQKAIEYKGNDDHEDIPSILKDYENLILSKCSITTEHRPDFSKIKDGEHFMYNSIEFIRLGKEQGGIFCITAKVWKELPFDKNSCNNYTKSSLRKELQERFLPLLDEADLLPYEMDLTADNGDTAYGKCTDKVGLISCDLYRKYRNFIPLFDEFMWTCTAWHCISGNANNVRDVHASGALGDNVAYSAFGVVPACIFKDIKEYEK